MCRPRPLISRKLARLFWAHATNSDCHVPSLGQNNTERWENNWSDKAEASESAHTEGQWFFYFNFVVLVLYLRVLASLLLLEVWGRCADSSHPRTLLFSLFLCTQPVRKQSFKVSLSTLTVLQTRLRHLYYIKREITCKHSINQVTIWLFTS